MWSETRSTEPKERGNGSDDAADEFGFGRRRTNPLLLPSPGQAGANCETLWRVKSIFSAISMPMTLFQLN